MSTNSNFKTEISMFLETDVVLLFFVLLSWPSRRPNSITIRDPTPPWVCGNFYDLSSQLGPILAKDSVRCFLRLYVTKPGMSWDFNVDMVKLLFRHGASASVRTVGGANMIEGLLPLHVAVHNTCLHRYLEDNLYPVQHHRDYVYMLIHLLCLPGMKILLDTTRVLAAKTDDLVDELWKYMKDGKIIQSAVLLLAAQEQIRGGCRSSKINGNEKKQDGFSTLMHRIVRSSVALRWGKCQNRRNSRKQLEEKRALLDCTGLLADIIFQAGEVLSAYIQTHSSEVPYVNVLDRVTDILEEFGCHM